MRRFYPLDTFALPPSEREPETVWDREERRRAVAFIFRHERNAIRRANIRAAADRIMREPRGRTSHRVGAAKSTTSGGSDDDGEGGDGDPPGKLERVAVATVDPSGRRVAVCIEVDPARTDAATMLFIARQAAGHDLATSTRGLDRLRVQVVHPYATKGGVA